MLWSTGDGAAKYKSNGVLTIRSGATVTIATPKQTTDRIEVQSGITANITLAGVNIAPNPTDGYMGHYGQGRPFSMKGTRRSILR